MFISKQLQYTADYQHGVPKNQEKTLSKKVKITRSSFKQVRKVRIEKYITPLASSILTNMSRVWPVSLLYHHCKISEVSQDAELICSSELSISLSKEDVKILKPKHHFVSDRARVTQAPLPVMPYKDMPYYIRLRR